jgi:hypothetical protein
MKALRRAHLILGCFFAPLISFFAISGIWQTIGTHSLGCNLVSTLHTGFKIKTGQTLSSLPFKCLNVIMAVSLFTTIIIGVVIALKTSTCRRTALIALFGGIVFPALLVLIHLFL